MSIRITNHSCYDKGIVSNTDNISSIIDKMIRLTAKLTEYYASDIIYDIDNLKSAVTSGTSLDVLLFFRECGVTTRGTTEFNEGALDVILFNFTPIQVWRLTHDPEKTETKLIRVNVYKEFSLK